MWKKKWAAALLAILALGGCASISRGTSEQIQLLSEPPGAEAQTSVGYVCVTPCIVQAPRSSTFGVVFSKAGFRKTQVLVRVGVSGQGAAAFAGNILLGGAVGMVADAATGAGLDHCPNPIKVVLTRDKPGAPIEVLDPCKPVVSPPAPDSATQ